MQISYAGMDRVGMDWVGMDWIAKNGEEIKMKPQDYTGLTQVKSGLMKRNLVIICENLWTKVVAIFSPRTLRKGQTAIEYSLIMFALLFVFSMMYRSLQWYLSKEFESGGIVILKMYKEDPW